MKMKKCLIWGTGRVFEKYYKMIALYEEMGALKVIGITSNALYYKNILGVDFIPKAQIEPASFDCLIIMAESTVLRDITREAIAMGIDDKVIIPVKVLALSGFDFDKYIAIKKNVPTIISPNCWGGLLYNHLGLEFKSPFINMFEEHTDYLKILKNLDLYMESELEFAGMKEDGNSRQLYPVAKCADVLLHFNHAASFEEANECWERRKKRMNMNNSIVMFYDDDPQKVNQFMKLDYKDKICFVPYSSDNRELTSLIYKKSAPEIPFGKIINDGPMRGYQYDLFELLLNKRICKLTEFK